MAEIEIAPIAECTDVELLTQADKEYISKFNATKRRNEITSWRVLLRRTLRRIGLVTEAENDILYSKIGAPYIADCKLHIGVSHSASHVAIIIDTKPCSIDIESLDRNFHNVASRYASPNEQQLLVPTAKTPLLPLLWSAKETLYKVSGDEGLDLLNDLRVITIEPQHIIGEILKNKQRVVMHHTLLDNHIVVYTA